MPNIVNLLRKIFPTLRTLPPEAVKPIEDYSVDDLRLLKQMNVVTSVLKDAYEEATLINYDRDALYREFDRACDHWLMSSSVDLFADYATRQNATTGLSVWVNSDDTTYKNLLTTFLEDIGIEERIYDWAWTLGAYGDLFVQVDGQPRLGIISVEDSFHPGTIGRLDYNGVLLGFYQTPNAGQFDNRSEQEVPLIAPWEYCHMRLLGAKKKRNYGQAGQNSNSSEARSIYLMGADTKQLTSRYGTSLLLNGLPVYKRLRMAEDALLMARTTRGILKYMYKIRMADNQSNFEAAQSIVQMYVEIIKNAKALNTDPNNPNYENRFNPMANVEDLFLPVFGEKNDIEVQELGGSPDIKWIVDLEMLRNQLCCSLRVPASLLGGFVDEASGSLGSEAIAALDIRFSRASRRLQRAVRVGITKLCQIHLAYMGYDSDPKLFSIEMSENSSEDEKQVKEALDTGTDVIVKFLEMLKSTGKQFDELALIETLSEKLIKLNDLDLKSYLLKDQSVFEPGTEQALLAGAEGGTTGAPIGGQPAPEKNEPITVERIALSPDLYGYLPMVKKGTIFESNHVTKEDWDSKWSGKKIKITKK